MKNNIQKLINFFQNPENRCRGHYTRNGKYCILGAMAHLLSVEDEYEVKKYLLSLVESFTVQYNRQFSTSKAPGYIPLDTLNLATFNDGVDHKNFMSFLEYALNSAH